MKPYDHAADGWRALPAFPLPGGLGILWSKRVNEQWLYGLPTNDSHANINGTIHGGVLMAFADHGLGALAWEAAERAPCATIQLNTHFLDGIKPGEFMELRGEITRRTRGLVFVRGVIAARNLHGVRDAGAMDGVWRVLRPR